MDRRANYSISRRDFLRRMRNGILATGFVAVSGAGLGLAINAAEHKSSPLKGEPIPTEKTKIFKTDPSGDVFEIPVRTQPRESALEVGYAKPGQIVAGRAYYGPTYRSSNDSLGKFEGPDGELYGKWFRLDSVTVYTNSAQVEQAGIARNVFVSGNFLKLATEEERAEFYRSSE